MSIQELEEKIEKASYEDKQSIVNSISLEECIQILNGENLMAKESVATRKKYTIADIKYLSDKISSFYLDKIIYNFNVKSKEDLNDLLSLSSLSENDKDSIFF